MNTNTHSKSRRLIVAAAGLATALFALAGCAGNAGSPAPSANAGVLIDKPSCDRNRAAGPITYISGYGYSASAAQIDVFVAKELGYFEAEVQKLDSWADDLKVGLENSLRELDREITDVRRTASVAPTLDEKLHWQKRQRELEEQRSKLRRQMFERQDEIDERRSRLIEELEGRLASTVQRNSVFVIQWELA